MTAFPLGCSPADDAGFLNQTLRRFMIPCNHVKESNCHKDITAIFLKQYNIVATECNAAFCLNSLSFYDIQNC